MFTKVYRPERDGVTETVPVDGMGASPWEKYLDPRPHAEAEASLAAWAIVALADAWERAQCGTEEVERLRAAVVAMRGGK